MAASTRCLVSSPTLRLPCTTFETVLNDTPAAAATSLIRAGRRSPTPVTGGNHPADASIHRNRSPKSVLTAAAGITGCGNERSTRKAQLMTSPFSPLTRRRFFTVSGAVAGGLALAACGNKTAPPGAGGG